MRRGAGPSVSALVVCLLAASAASCGGRPGPGGGDAGEGAGGGERPRVILVGLDGADWRVIRPLVQSGRLPAFERLLREGATGVLHSMEPSASPSLWTTVATGVSPARHGIHGFVVGEGEDDGGRERGGAAEPGEAAGRRADGTAVRPVTSGMRRSPAFWNVLPRYGLKVGVVGWLVTWPAEPVDGYIVSSYLPYIYSWSTGRPLKGTIVSGIPRQTFPEGLIDRLEPLKVRPSDLDAATVGRFYDPATVAGLSVADRECVTGFLWSLACDETYRRIGLDLFATYPVDLFAVYFGGIDVASHRFWKFAFPEARDYGVAPAETAALGRVVPETYVYADGLVGEYLARLRPSDTLIVLSDHGFRPVLFPGKPTTSGHHRDEGMVALLGRGVRRGTRIEAASLLDILPTICVLLDVPLARNLEGRPIDAALDEDFARRHPPRFVAAYDTPGAPGGPESSDLDRNILERLRSLGYIN